MDACIYPFRMIERHCPHSPLYQLPRNSPNSQNHLKRNAAGIWQSAPYQLCQFHLLRERKRNIDSTGFSESNALLGTANIERARDYASRIVG